MAADVPKRRPRFEVDGPRHRRRQMVRSIRGILWFREVAGFQFDGPRITGRHLDGEADLRKSPELSLGVKKDDSNFNLHALELSNETPEERVLQKFRERPCHELKAGISFRPESKVELFDVEGGRDGTTDVRSCL